MDELTITLRKPVSIGDITYSELKLQEPTAGQIEKASTGSQSSVGAVINLISAVAVVPRKMVEGLCQRDFKEASKFLESFDDVESAQQ
ncbi:phage tail assembly protein [Rhodoferax sp. GW822-FHT02A01]|uniref:phage tail assembly protein n=1 Tax=Rhodoferax sp. GW822-FHT02A01 TaxID=3141537 RepID=UPI00315DA537